MNIKTLGANVLAKSAKLALNVAGRNGTHFTGGIALKIDKDYIKNTRKPKNIISITGTNGKTTTANMITDILEILNKDVISNRLGSNIINGIASLLANDVKLFGQVPEFGVIEQDELWMRHYNHYLNSNSLTVTNLFQDSFDRNANVDYVFNRINQAINDGTKLILNASDSISAYLGNDTNERVYFTILPLEGERECRDATINDLIYCPHCQETLEWDFKRYHHIGFYKCDQCGFSNPKAKYVVTSIDKQNNLLHITDDGQEFELPLINPNIENSYNQIAAYATLRENGFNKEDIRDAMKNIKVVSTRFDERKIKNKRVISLVAKELNPIATSRNFYNIKNHPGNKTLLYLTDYEENALLDHTLSWVYSSDFKYIKDVDKIIFFSKFAGPAQLACQMAGMDPDKIIIIDKIEDFTNYIDKDVDETIYVIHDIVDYGINISKKSIDLLKKYMR